MFTCTLQNTKLTVTGDNTHLHSKRLTETQDCRHASMVAQPLPRSLRNQEINDSTVL